MNAHNLFEEPDPPDPRDFASQLEIGLTAAQLDGEWLLRRTTAQDLHPAAGKVQYRPEIGDHRLDFHTTGSPTSAACTCAAVYGLALLGIEGHGIERIGPKLSEIN